MNLLLGSSDASLEFWHEEFVPALLNKYNQALSPEETSNDIDFCLKYFSNAKHIIFFKLQKFLGLRFQHNEEFLWNSPDPLDVIDLEEITETIKQVNT